MKMVKSLLLKPIKGKRSGHIPMLGDETSGISPIEPIIGTETGG